MRWSWSRVRRYMTCPHAYQLRYVKRLTEPMTDYYSQGRFLHETIEAYAKHCYAIERETDVDWLEARRVVAEEPWQRQQLEAIAQFIGFDWTTALVDVSGIERSFDVALPNGDRLIGRTDFAQYSELNDTLYITDYKLGYAVTGGEEVPGQLLLYAWALLQELPQPETVVVSYSYPCIGRSREWRLQPPVDIEWFLELIEQITRDGIWPARPSLNACSRCGYALEGCEVVKRQELLCRDGVEARLLLAQIAAYKGFIAQATQLLADWCRTQGPLETAGLKAGYARHVRALADEREIAALIAKYGRDPAHFVKPSLLISQARALYGTLTERGVDPHRFMRLDLAKVLKVLGTAEDGQMDNPFVQPDEEELASALRSRIEEVETSRFAIAKATDLP